MNEPWFFGYGSLVNRATHTYAQAQTASLSGYRRVWRATPLRALAFLSIEPAPGSTIQGLIAAVPNADWTALDEREAAYSRRIVTPHITPAAPDMHIWAYAVTEPLPMNQAEDHPILQSYLDAVLLGFLKEFGPGGIAHFLETTSGWQHPIHNDRADPLYPRAQKLSQNERTLIDTALAER